MIKNYFLTFAFMVSILGFGQQLIGSAEFEPSNINTIASEAKDEVIAERNSELVFIKLRASAPGNSYITDIYFNDNASRGFDLGYDAGFFGAVPNFVLYSLLAENNVGLPLVIQAVNTSDLSGVEIPLVVGANQGQELTITIANSTIPESINVYLDDTVANTSTLLNDSDYVITPATAISGAGRYFLRISEPSTTYTYNDSWSPSDPNGVATAGDDILIVSGHAIIDTDTSCNTLTVNPGAGLTVNSGVILTATSGLTLESTSTTYSSLILDGSVAGTMNYERHVNINGSGTTGSNDLVSAPLTGQSFNAFAAANPNLFSNTAGDLFLFGPYEKTAGEFLTYSDTETATLDAGVGYRAATDDNGALTFTGTAENGVVTNNIINTEGPSSTRPEWNLVGNPYPSYLNVQDFLTHDVGGVLNFQLFDAATAAIYGYDGSATNGWTVYNLATTTPSTLIAPGQGFFVSADATNDDLYDLTFTPAMRSTGTGDDFIAGRNAELVYVKLKASTANKAYGTDIYFNSNASLGFDLGYDAALWDATTPDFALYSSLVQDNLGDAMAIQAVSSTNLSDVVIPLGVNANQGEALTFSISDMTLPASVNVYLEDVVENTVTLLNNSDYIITPTTNLSGTGRFFLRTSEDGLSTIDNTLDNLTIIALNASKELVVSGQLQENTVLNLFDIQGRIVLSTKLDSSVMQNRLDVSNVSGGVYVVTLNNNGQEKTQKVVIK